MQLSMETKHGIRRYDCVSSWQDLDLILLLAVLGVNVTISGFFKTQVAGYTWGNFFLIKLFEVGSPTSTLDLFMWDDILFIQIF